MLTPRPAIRSAAFRTRLFHGTALAAAIALAPQAARAQALPSGGTITAGTVTASATNATVAGTGAAADPFVTSGIAANGALGLVVGTGAGAAGQNAVIQWNSFDIGAGNAVNFSGAGGIAYSALNRIDGGSPTVIAGSLTGGGNGSIFVINEAGISFSGASSVTNLAGFVASSLDITDPTFAAFATGSNTAVRFATSTLLGTGTGTGANGITIDAGASIAPDSVLLLVAPMLTIGAATLGTATAAAATADIGFVLAHDATVTMNPTSLIQVAIAAGTPMTGSTIGATVNGTRVTLAAASTVDLLGALLGVSGAVSANVATATAQGIVLAVGAPDAANTVTFTPATRAGLDATGTLASTGRVDVAANGALALSGNVAATGAVAIAGGTIDFPGTVAHTLSSARALSLTATTGAITAAADVTLLSNLGGGAAAGLGDLTLTAVTAIGDVAAPRITATTGLPADNINIGVGAGSDLGLTAATVGTLITTGNLAGTLATTGAIRVDTINTSALNVTTTGAITLGAVTTAGNAFIRSGAAGTGAAVNITGNAAVGGDLTVIGGSVGLGTATVASTQSAVGSVLIRSTVGDIRGDTALTADSTGAGGRPLVLDSTGSITALGGTMRLTSGTVATPSDVLIRTGGNVALGAIDANSLARADAAVVDPIAVSDYAAVTANTLDTGGAIDLGAVALQQASTISSNGTLVGARDVRIAGLRSATGSVEIAATTGDVVLSGPVSANSAAVVHADLGTLTVGSVSAFGNDAVLTGRTAILKAGGAQTIAALGNVALISDGAITVDTVRAGGTLSAGGLTGGNAASVTGDSFLAGGQVAVSASGAIALFGTNAASAQSVGSGLNATLANFTGGAVGAANVILNSTGSTVTINDVRSTRDIIGSGSSFILGTSGAAHTLTAARAVELTATSTAADAIGTSGDFTITGGTAAALLQGTVGANVTQNDSLSITGTSVLVGNIAVAASPPALFGSGNVVLGATGPAVTGSVTAGTVASRGAVTAASTNAAVTLGGATSGGGGDVTVTAAGPAAVAGPVSSAGNYAVIGNTVGLGSAATPTQSAAGDVLIRSTAGLFASGTLVADSVGAGNRRLVLAGTGLFTNGGGNVNLRAGAGATATAANRSDILLALNPASNLALGTVDADAFSGATGPGTATLVGQYTPTVGLVTSGQITTGAITTIQSVQIGSSGTLAGRRDVTIGGVASSSGSVEVFATNGNVTLTGPVAAATTASLHADAAALTVGDVAAFGGAATLSGGTTLTSTGTVKALGNVLLASPGAIAVDTVRAGGQITARGLTAGSTAASFAAKTLDATDSIAVEASGLVDLTIAGATGITTHRGAIDANLNGFGGVASPTDSAIALTSTGGDVRAGAIASTGDVTLSATSGIVTASGDVSVGDTATLATHDRYFVFGRGVALGGVGISQSARGDILVVASAGSISGAGTLAADTAGTGNRRLVLDATSGLLRLNGTALSLRAGTGTTAMTRSDVLLRPGGAGTAIDLGGIFADNLAFALGASGTTVAAYSPQMSGATQTLVTAGAITLGNVATVADTVIGTTAGSVVTTGGVTSAGSITLSSATGEIVAGGAVDAATTVTITASAPNSAVPAEGRITVGDVFARGGAAVLEGTSIVTAGGGRALAASGNVALIADGAIGVDTVRAGGFIRVAGRTAGTPALSLTGTSLRANAGITVDTTGAINLTNAGGLTVATERRAIDANLLGFNGGTVGAATIALTSASSVTVGDLASTGNITLTAGGAAAATGTVTAGDALTAAGSGNYTVIGGTVVLGAAGVSQSAIGPILIRSTATTIAGSATLAADTRGLGSRPIVLDAATSVTGGLVLVGGTGAGTSDALIRVGTGGGLALGNVTANQLASVTAAANPAVVADYTVPTATRLATTGAISLGAVSTVQSTIVGSSGSASGQRNVDIAGVTSTTGSVEVFSDTGGVSLAGPVAAVTGVNLHADFTVADPDPTRGLLTLGNVSVGNGDATLLGGRGITTFASGGPFAIAARGNVLLASPGAISVDAVRARGMITVGGLTVGSAAGSLVGNSLAANGDIAVTTVGGIDLTNGTAPQLATQRRLLDANLGGFNGAATAPDAAIALTSTGGAVTVADLAATGDITLDAATTLTATGTLTGGDATTDALRGKLSARGGSSIALGGATHTANNDVELRSDGTIAFATILSGGAITAGVVTPGSTALSLTGTTLQANGAINVAAPGGLTLTGTGAARTATVRPRFDPGLRTFTLGTDAADAALTLSGGAVTVADLASTGNIALTGTGLVTVTGTGNAGDDNVLGGASTYTVTSTLASGPAISLGAVQSANGNVLLNVDGAIDVAEIRAGGTLTARGFTAANAASLNGTSLQANGAINVTASGAVDLTGTGATVRTNFDRATRTFAAASNAVNAGVTISGGAVTLADLASTGDIALTGTGRVRVTGTGTAGDAMTATAGGVGTGGYTVSSLVASGAGIDLAATQSANGAVVLNTAGSVVVDTVRAGGTITVQGPTAAGAASLDAVTLQANGAIGVTTAGPIVLTGTGAARTATVRSTFDPAARTFTLGTSAADATITLTAMNGASGTISVGDLASTGNIALSASGTVAVTGTVAAGDAMTTAGSGTYSVAGSAITLGGGIAGQAALGNILLASPGAVVVTALRSGGTIGIRGATAGTAAASLSGDSLEANGAITVATTGAIDLAGINAPSIATRRRAIDANLLGFNGLNVADADILLTTTAGDIGIASGVSTGDITLTAGTGGVSGAAVVTGGLTAGDTLTINPRGSIVVDARAAATLATATARHAISVISRAGDATIGTVTAGTDGLGGGTILARVEADGLALITSGTTTIGDIRAEASETGGRATITSATAQTGTVIATTLDGAATVASGQSAVAGDVRATVAGGTATATITTGRSATGNVAATQSGTGTATVVDGVATGGDVTATAGGLANITNGNAGGSVIASGGTATVATGIAAAGNVDALATGSATIGSGSATLGNVRALSTGGAATITTLASAGRSVIARGTSVAIAPTATTTAGDDIILIATGGGVSARNLTVTGMGTDVAATDGSGGPLTFGAETISGFGGSNVIVRATGAAALDGIVAVAQGNAARTADLNVVGGTVTLGRAGQALDQRAAGRVDVTATAGDVVFAGVAGQLQSNVGGARIAVADAATAGGGLTITASRGIGGTPAALGGPVTLAAATPGTPLLLANAATGTTQARQPGLTLAAAASGGGSVRIASVAGGAVSIAAPGTIEVPLVTASNTVSITGVAPSGNDTATVLPTTITIDGLASGFAPVDVTVSGGAGAEVTALATVNGGLLGNVAILADTGAATLRGAPAAPVTGFNLIVESQTGAASILSPSPIAAQTITLRGRRAGSSVLATGPLLASGAITATGPTVTLGTVTVAGTAGDGTGDIQIAATDAASLAAGIGEAATARRTIGLTAGTTATLGDGTATGGALGVRGATVNILRSATAGDDVVLASLGAINAAGATIATTGTVDLQGGIDVAASDFAATTMVAGSGYGTGAMVIDGVLTTATDATTGGAVTLRGGGNVIATAAGAIDFAGATLRASGALARDVRVESGATLVLQNASASRGVYLAATGNVTPTGVLAAGDDLVVVSGGGIDARTATLRTVGGALSLADARRADGTLLNSAAAGGTLAALGGSNIALAAGGAIQLGRIETLAATAASLRAFAGGAITTNQAVTTTGSIVLAGLTVADTFGLTAGDDIVVVARGGAATLGGTLTTTGGFATDTPLVDLAGNAIALAGSPALARVDGSSILVAATGTVTVSTTVASAGRYSVYGRGGVALGTAVVGPATGTSQTAARDVLIEASIGAVPAPADVTLADGMTLASNIDGIGIGAGISFGIDGLVVRLGNGSLNASGATLRAGRSTVPPSFASFATLPFQPTVSVQPVVTDGVKTIAIGTLDTASADLRALNNVTVSRATVDAGLTLASKAGSAALTTLTVGSGVPLMTTAEAAAIDLRIYGATGATLGDVVTPGANRIRDIVVATTNGAASITGAAAARDDIVVASTTGAANAASLTFTGAAADSEAGVATVAAVDANNVALTDPYAFTGATITGLAGRNIVVSGATGATLGTVTTASADAPADVRVLTAAGPATLTTVAAGAVLPNRVIVATRNGAATATTINAAQDIVIDATLGTATLGTGVAGRDGIVVGPSVAIGSLTVGDDVVAVASSGTLTADTLTSTGANSGDAIATIARAGGAAIVDPVAGGSVGGMTGGNVVALASSNATVTTAAAPTLVRIGSAGGGVTTTTATASTGDVVLLGATVDAGALSAGRDVVLTTTAGDLRLGSAATTRDLILTSANDIVVSGSASAGGAATLTAARNIGLAGLAAAEVTALTTGGAAALTAGRDIVVARRIVAGTTLTLTATTGAVTLAGTTAGATTIQAQGDLASSADLAATGTLGLTSTAGGITAPSLAGAGITLTAANAITVSGATTSTGGLGVTSASGSGSFGSLDVGAAATLRTGGALAVGGATRTGGALTATSDTSTIRTDAVTTGGAATITADGANGAITLASLTTTGAGVLRAGQSVTVTGAAATTGALTATATNGALAFGSINAGGAATLRARTGLSVTGLARAGAALDALSTAGALSFGSTQAATTLTLRGATGVTVAGASSAGGLVTLTADTGAVATGDIATSGDTLVTATTGSVNLGGQVSTANYTVTAATGSITLGGAATATQRATGVATLASQRLTLGAGTTLVAGTQLALNVSAPAGASGNPVGVALGGSGPVADRYGLSRTALRQIQTPWLQINAGALPVDIGEVNLDGVAPATGGLGFAGITQSFGIRTTGDIGISDTLTFTSATGGTVRKLTLGGVAARLPTEAAPISDDLDKTTPTANAIRLFARSTLDNSAVNTGGQINATGSTVQLRATYIGLGEKPTAPDAGRPFLDALFPTATTALTTAQAKTQFVDNPTSTLFVATSPYTRQTPAPQALVRAGILTLAPGQWALVQNTGPSTTPGGGILVDELRFTKVAGATAADPVISVFGGVAGKTGFASAVSVTQLDGISPNNIRINGCVALSTAGCIQSALSIPLINLADPGRTLLISNAPSLALSVELITGATNEALWREDDDEPGQNRPQRESRP